MRLDLFNDRGSNYAHLSSLVGYSPHLLLHLERMFSREDLLSELEGVFALSLQYGGLRELDFERPIREVKFNPRPARVVLILIRDAGVRDLELIRAAIAACSWGEADAPAHFSALLRPSEMALAELSNRCQNLQEAKVIFSDSESVEIDPKVLLLSLSLFLDRIRHVHRSALKLELRPNLVELAKLFLQRAERSSDMPGIASICMFVRHWLKRVN